MSINNKTTREALRDALGEMATGKERKILSHGALLAYINGTDHFSDFLSETTGDDYIDVRDTISYIPQFVEYLNNSGYSYYTVTLWLYGVCKATGANIRDYLPNPKRG